MNEAESTSPIGSVWFAFTMSCSFRFFDCTPNKWTNILVCRCVEQVRASFCTAGLKRHRSFGGLTHQQVLLAQKLERGIEIVRVDLWLEVESIEAAV
eukprot:SAG11_NODE_18383_length_492_cov_1.600509_1_plen_96_part_10